MLKAKRKLKPVTHTYACVKAVMSDQEVTSVLDSDVTVDTAT